MKKERELKYIEEINKESREEKFPIKKEFDLNKELDDALENLNMIAEFSFIIKRIKIKEDTQKDLIKLHEFLNRVATVKIILEKIKSRMKSK